MLSLPPTVRIYLAAQPTDLRKSFDSLAAVVREGLQGDPMSGDVFVFRNKAADRIKLLIWEEDGYAIWYKRLEAGSYRFPPAPGELPRGLRSDRVPLPLRLDVVVALLDDEGGIAVRTADAVGPA